MDLRALKVLTFDCYGTLIDWEEGILSALRPTLSDHRLDLPDDHILEIYSRLERQYQREQPFANYRSILRRIVQGLAAQLGVDPGRLEPEALSESLKEWKPFPDTVPALKVLKERYRLAIISNVDLDLFAHSAKYLQVPFDWVITSEEVQAYKPSRKNFQYALRTIGVPQGQHLHVAQSLYHDIAPAKELGLATAWINRRGASNTPIADTVRDLEVPDLESLASLLTPAS